MSECPPNTDVLSASKKIKKTKNANSQDEDSKMKADANDCKKYKTVDSPTKKKILLDLKKAIIAIENYDLKPEDISTARLLQMLEKVELTTYNKMLTKVLTRHFPTFTATTRSLTQWRRKIKGWVNSSDKPENRGGLLIAHDKLGIFRERVIQILKSMPARVFLTLRNRILEVLEEFHYDNGDKNQIREFNRNTCSKHWWFNFMRRNQDIKDLWESIPLERMLHKDKNGDRTRDDEEDSTDDSSPNHNLSSLESLTIPNPLSALSNSLGANPLFPALPPALMSLLQEGLPSAMTTSQSTNNSGDIIKKEEEAGPTPLVRREPSIEAKVEETKTSGQIIAKNEEEATKAESTNDTTTTIQREPQLPASGLPAPQIDYLPMLLQQKKLIDFLILMRLKRGY